MSANPKKNSMRCEVCECQVVVMKRCTQCRAVYYCSRDCQMKHWNIHKSVCLSSNNNVESASSDSSAGQRSQIAAHKVSQAAQFKKNDNTIFYDPDKEEQVKKSCKPDEKFCTPVDFKLAVCKISSPSKKGLGSSDMYSNSCKAPTELNDGDTKNTYLFENKHHSDLPILDKSLAFCEVTVKSNRTKYKISLQTSWMGTEVYKVLANTLSVPVDKLKLIHKGKIMTENDIHEWIRPKAIFQAIGEQAESEDGLEKNDIDIVMLQSGVDRNCAIQALRKKGDIVDAIFEITNK